MKSTAPRLVCSGTGQVPLELGPFQWRRGMRAECPVCHRSIAVGYEGQLVRHGPKVTQRTRLNQEARRMATVQRAMVPLWPPVAVLVRLWFRDYGGAEAFAVFAARPACVGCGRGLTELDSATWTDDEGSFTCKGTGATGDTWHIPRQVS